MLITLIGEMMSIVYYVTILIAFREVLEIEQYSPKQLRKRPAASESPGDLGSTVSKAMRAALDVSIEWHSQDSQDSHDDTDADAGLY